MPRRCAKASISVWPGGSSRRWKTGGPRGGGTRLTAEGLDCVRRFRRCTAGLQDLIEQRFAEAFEKA